MLQISPVSILSQDKVDPFRTNPHAILPKRLQSILELGKSKLAIVKDEMTDGTPSQSV